KLGTQQRRETLGETVRHVKQRSSDQRKPDVVNRPQLRTRLSPVSAGCELAFKHMPRARAVIVADVEISVEGERVRDDQVMSGVTLAARMPVRNQAGHPDDDRDHYCTFDRFPASEA